MFMRMCLLERKSSAIRTPMESGSMYSREGNGLSLARSTMCVYDGIDVFDYLKYPIGTTQEKELFYSDGKVMFLSLIFRCFPYGRDSIRKQWK